MVRARLLVSGMCAAVLLPAGSAASAEVPTLGGTGAPGPRTQSSLSATRRTLKIPASDEVPTSAASSRGLSVLRGLLGVGLLGVGAGAGALGIGAARRRFGRRAPRLP